MENGIYKAIAGVIADIGAVGKNGTNERQKFKYRTIDDVYSVLNPALAKNKMFILPEITEMQKEIKSSREGNALSWVTLTIKYTLFAEDGSSLSTTLKGEAFDTGDKGINKAMVNAFKYLCFQVFCIPVEETCDPDRESHEFTENRKSESKASNNPAAKIDENMHKALRAEMERTGITQKTLLKYLEELGNVYLELTEINVNDFKKLMSRLEKTPSVKKDVSFEECMSM